MFHLLGLDINQFILFKDWFKIVVSDTSMYQEAGNSIVVDVLIAILKQMDITKYGTDED